jgi:hypothetical protein
MMFIIWFGNKLFYFNFFLFYILKNVQNSLAEELATMQALLVEAADGNQQVASQAITYTQC